MTTGNHAGHDSMPEQIRVARAHYQGVHGITPPVNEAEAYSRKNSEDTSHPYDSFMDDADVEVISALDATTEDEEDFEVMADGGYEHERVFESDPADVSGTASEYGIDVSSYGDELIAVRGDRTEVNEFVTEVRQAMGKEVTPDEIERGFYDVEPSEPASEEQAEKAIADGGRVVTPIDSDPRYGEDGEPHSPEEEKFGIPYGGFSREVKDGDSSEPGSYMGDFPM